MSFLVSAVALDDEEEPVVVLLADAYWCVALLITRVKGMPCGAGCNYEIDGVTADTCTCVTPQILDT